MRFLTRCILSSVALLPGAAHAVTLKPIIDTRLRYEHVDQQGIASEADAVVARVRLGIEAIEGPLSFLVEAEGTMALSEKYSSGLNRKTLRPAATG
ncbi:MAG: hypothetical protein EOP61_38380, partial [Sphingomonadales bacterium]